LPELPSPFTKTDKDIRVSIRLTPNASNNRIIGIVADEKGKGVLRIAVTALPEHGLANTAMISFLAKQWSLPKSSLTLRNGSKDRNKTLSIKGGSARHYEDLLVWSRNINGE
jgi:uncharacterized protein YggU (UPF0235/DUF167 family)